MIANLRRIIFTLENNEKKSNFSSPVEIKIKGNKFRTIELFTFDRRKTFPESFDNLKFSTCNFSNNGDSVSSEKMSLKY